MVELDPFRTGPAYSISQAAVLAGTSHATIRRWLKGYEYRAARMEPVFEDKARADGSAPQLSFLDLAEIIIAVRFTQYGGKLEKVRAARRFAEREWRGLVYPFASLRLKMLGGELLHQVDREFGGPALAVSLSSREGLAYTLPFMVLEALDLFDFDEEYELASRWFPAGRDVPLVVDPHFAAGRLSIVGRGVTVSGIYRRFKGGQRIGFIAEDLELDASAVEEAIRYVEAA